ncbi:MAG: gliding motility lipoprotein GldH [Bacteroidaceae bacterium]|nr:gliding motility lipoprotein GldH [Bacteroidaceae bacterium]
MKGDTIVKTDLRPKSSLLLLFGLLLLISCTGNVVYNDYVAIPGQGWESHDGKEFVITLPANDSYDINLFVRHGSLYQYSNLWLFVDHISPDNVVTTDTVNIILADAYGNWQGKGWGNSHQVEVNIAHKQPLDSGVHVVRLNQAMREYKLRGIANIGVSVEKSR